MNRVLMARLPETWRLLCRSLAVPTLLIAGPLFLAGFWVAWRHFLGPIDTLTECALVTAPVLIVEAVASLIVAVMLVRLIDRGALGQDAAEACADVLTLLVLGFGASSLLTQWSSFLGDGGRLHHLLHPKLFAEIATAGFIFLRLRSNNSRLRFEQFNLASEPAVPVFFVVLAILLPWRLHWRRFDPLPPAPLSQPAPHDKPDVILVTFDALSAQDMSLFQYHLPTTPNFQRLAQTSHVFSHFYSTSDFTTPAVTSLLTGKDLFSHHVYQLDGMLPESIRSENLAALLAANGYRTAAIVTNAYAHPLHLGLDESFEYLPEPPANPWLRAANWPLQIAPSLLYHSHASPTSWLVSFAQATGKYFPSFNQNPSVDASEVFRDSERLIDGVPGPLFIWIHVLPPHFPYVTRPPWRGRFLSGDQYTVQTDFGPTQDSGPYDQSMQAQCDMLRLRYDESISECDAALGSLLDWLGATGRRANTLLVVSADHGESFNRQWWGHASSDLHYAEVHIPLLISLPGQKDSVWHGEDSGLADVAPSILAALGIQAPSWMSKRALVSSRMTDTSHSPVFAAYLARSYIFGPPRGGTVAALSGDYELVWYFPEGTKKLFDIHSDPDENNDVIGAYPEIAAPLVRAIALKFGAEVPALKDDRK